MAFDETSPEQTIPLNKKIAYSIILGTIITLVTSQLPNNTVIGASNTGYPFPWLSQPLYPIGSPATIIWEALLIDAAVWTIVGFVLVIIYQIIKSR
jgi:hypothetical protein